MSEMLDARYGRPLSSLDLRELLQFSSGGEWLFISYKISDSYLLMIFNTPENRAMRIETISYELNSLCWIDLEKFTCSNILEWWYEFKGSIFYPNP